jgi:hypothetical protein
MVKRIAVIVVVGTLWIARAAQAQMSTPIPQDTATVQAAHMYTVPTYTGGVKGDVTQISLMNQFSLTVTLPRGITSTTLLKADESDFRIQDQVNKNKGFTSNIIYLARPGFSIDGAISDTRYFNRVITYSNATQDLENNQQRAQANAQYGRALGRGLAVNGRSSLAVSSEDQTFVKDQTGEGALHAGVRYGPGKDFEVSARGFLRMSAQNAESGNESYSGLGATEDSVLAGARVTLLDSVKVKAEYSRFLSKDDYLEMPVGSYGEKQYAPATPEQQSKDMRDISVSAEARFPGRIVLTASAEHTDGATYFAQATQRTSRDVGDSQTGALTFSPFSKTTLAFDAGNREIFHWLGPSRTGSYNDKEIKTKFNWTQTVTQTLRFVAQTGASLAQSFYVDTDRDRDQRYVFANVRLISKLFPKVDATVYLSASKTDYVAIRASFSQNNRAETIYELRPEFVYRINSRLELTQKYGINIQFADFVFQENENYLDRNVSFSNRLRARLTNTLAVDFYYALRRQDKGSYLRPEPDAERVLEISQKDRRDEMKIAFRYQVNPHIALLGSNDYSQRRDLLSPSRSPFTDGGVEVGVEGNYDFGGRRSLKFAMKRVKRFGQFNAPEQEDYWVMDSSLVYTF